MCFSATASLIAGTTLGVVGIVTISKVKQKREIPFAMIPLLFGIQQIAEGLIWLSLSNNLPLLNTVMTYVYSLFSHVIWPIFIPFAIGLLETVPWRKKVLSVFQTVGLAVGLYLLYFLVKFPITSEVLNKSITYNSPHFYLFAIMMTYFIATLLSPLFSSHRIINLFGVLAVAAAIGAYLFYSATFISVWCFFAAIVSFMIFLYFFYFNHCITQKTI